jgi:hypothetical protein
MERATEIHLAPLAGFGFWEKVNGGLDPRRGQFFDHGGRPDGGT